MRYFGGKYHISKELSTFINTHLNTNQTFVDLFCGSCNVISKINSDRKRIANDKHYFLIEMFKKLQSGWIPFDNCTKDQYYYYKQNRTKYPHIAGFVGFGCSFAGKWWGGYAKDNKNSNYCIRAKNSILKKMATLQDVAFENNSYNELCIPKNSFVYCDIPYKNTTPYCVSEVGKFSHEQFYKWVYDNKQSFTCYISEYKQNVPDNFKIIWELESKQLIRDKNLQNKKTIEVLITLK